MLSVGALLSTFAMQGANATEIVNRSVELLGRANSVVGVYTDSSKLGIATADFYLKKGAKLALLGASVSELCNGNDRYTVDRKKKTFTLKDTRIFGIPYIVGMEAFTINGKDTIAKTMALENVQLSDFDGKPVASYRINGSTVFVDVNTALPVGASYGEGTNKHTYRFKNLKVDAPVSDSVFEFNENGYSEVTVSEPGMAKRGSTVSLAGSPLMPMLAGKKAGVIVFFNDRTSASSDAVSKFIGMAKRTPKDVQLIAVPSAQGMEKSVKGKFGFPVVQNGFGSGSLSALFGVTKYPSVFVVDADGKVLHSQIGSRAAHLDPVLIDLGISRP